MTNRTVNSECVKYDKNMLETVLLTSTGIAKLHTDYGLPHF